MFTLTRKKVLDFNNILLILRNSNGRLVLRSKFIEKSIYMYNTFKKLL